MQRILITALALILCAGATSAQTAPSIAWPPSDPRSAVGANETRSNLSARDAAVADCEGMWDRGTHMTRQEWSRTCRRVQDRLRLLELK